MVVRKHSKQRDMIMDFLMTRKDHPTAETVYLNVREANPRISLGTVYRNLTLLADNGDILRLSLGENKDRFDADTSPHQHFICNDCGSVIDLDMDDIDYVTDVASKRFKGKIAGHVTYFHGTCEKCTKVHQ